MQFGWLVRSIHAWSANLMIFVLFLHMVSVLLLRAYRPPREMTWLSGIALLGLALALGFTGYLLPWNMLALFATKVGTDIPGAVPVVGDFIRVVLRGGEDVTGATLTRFYGIHVAVLPALITVVPGPAPLSRAAPWHERPARDRWVTFPAKDALPAEFPSPRSDRLAHRGGHARLAGGLLIPNSARRRIPSSDRAGEHPAGSGTSCSCSRR